MSYVVKISFVDDMTGHNIITGVDGRADKMIGIKTHLKFHNQNFGNTLNRIRRMIRGRVPTLTPEILI